MFEDSVLAEILSPRAAPEVLLVGPVTIDRFADREALGGTVLYAAHTVEAFGQEGAVLSVAADEAVESAFGNAIRIRRVESRETLTFVHRQERGGRRLRVDAAPRRTLQPSHLPADWARARTVILGPLLAGDIDIGAFAALDGVERFGITLQGVLRDVDAAGEVVLSGDRVSALLPALDTRWSVFFSRRESEVLGNELIAAIRARVGWTVITRGASGASVLSRSGAFDVASVPARRVDDTGAGDVFATAFVLAGPVGGEEAARIASCYASANVETVGAGPLPSLPQITRKIRVQPPAIRLRDRDSNP